MKEETTGKKASTAATARTTRTADDETFAKTYGSERPRLLDERTKAAVAEAATTLVKAGFHVDQRAPERRLDVAALVPARDSGDDRLRKAATTLVVASAIPFVKWMIRDRFGTYSRAFREDLEQAGHVGIVRAFARYDGSGRFLTYARHFVIGELADYVNFLHGQTKHYRALQEKVAAARDALVARGEPATPDAISRATGLSLKAVKRELEVSSRRFVSFEGLALAEVTEG